MKQKLFPFDDKHLCIKKVENKQIQKNITVWNDNSYMKINVGMFVKN